MIDLHSHILPGLDDGARSVEDGLEIARAAVDDGIAAIAGTPHVRHDFPTGAAEMEESLARLRSAVERAGIPLRLHPGGEIALDRLDRLSEDELRRFGLGGNPRYLLVEMPYYGWPLALPHRLSTLVSAGITPVLAHPERNADVQADPARLASIVRAGALVQVTAASVDGRVGRRARACGLELIDRGLAHLLASDAHHAAVRAVGMSAAARAVGDAALAEWLTSGVPGAIVDGAPLPPRPEGARRRGLLRGLLGGDS